MSDIAWDDEKMVLYRGIVFVNCALGIASVTIQMKLLIPWHDIISHQVGDLEKEQKSLEKRIYDLQQAIQKSPQGSLLAASNTKPRSGFFSKWF